MLRSEAERIQMRVSERLDAWGTSDSTIPDSRLNDA